MTRPAPTLRCNADDDIFAFWNRANSTARRNILRTVGLSVDLAPLDWQNLPHDVQLKLVNSAFIKRLVKPKEQP